MGRSTEDQQDSAQCEKPFLRYLYYLYFFASLLIASLF